MSFSLAFEGRRRFIVDDKPVPGLVGGFGAIHVAVDLREPHLPTVVKLMRRDRLGDDDAAAELVARVRREKRLAVEFADAENNFAEPLFARTLAGGESDRGPWIAMRRASGTLDTELRRGRVANMDAVRRLMLRVALAVGVMDLREIVHRDIKPANILLFDGRLALTDLGLAWDGRDEGLTPNANHVYGTGPRVPPDFRKQLSDSKRDVYALAWLFTDLVVGFVQGAPGQGMKFPQRLRQTRQTLQHFNADSGDMLSLFTRCGEDLWEDRPYIPEVIALLAGVPAARAASMTKSEAVRVGYTRLLEMHKRKTEGIDEALTGLMGYEDRRPARYQMLALDGVGVVRDPTPKTAWLATAIAGLHEREGAAVSVDAERRNAERLARGEGMAGARDPRAEQQAQMAMIREAVAKEVDRRLRQEREAQKQAAAHPGRDLVIDKALGDPQGEFDRMVDEFGLETEDAPTPTVRRRRRTLAQKQAEVDKLERAIKKQLAARPDMPKRASVAWKPSTDAHIKFAFYVVGIVLAGMFVGGGRDALAVAWPPSEAPLWLLGLVCALPVLGVLLVRVVDPWMRLRAGRKVARQFNERELKLAASVRRDQNRLEELGKTPGLTVAKQSTFRVRRAAAPETKYRTAIMPLIVSFAIPPLVLTAAGWASETLPGAGSAGRSNGSTAERVVDFDDMSVKVPAGWDIKSSDPSSMVLSHPDQGELSVFARPDPVRGAGGRRFAVDHAAFEGYYRADRTGEIGAASDDCPSDGCQTWQVRYRDNRVAALVTADAPTQDMFDVAASVQAQTASFRLGGAVIKLPPGWSGTKVGLAATLRGPDGQRLKATVKRANDALFDTSDRATKKYLTNADTSHSGDVQDEYESSGRAQQPPGGRCSPRGCHAWQVIYDDASSQRETRIMTFVSASGAPSDDVWSIVRAVYPAGDAG